MKKLLNDPLLRTYPRRSAICICTCITIQQ